MKRPQDQFTLVKGYKIRFWTQGEGASTVLLLHGISCSVLEWEYNIAALAQHHRVIALDLLGCGLSDKPVDADYDMQAQARFVFDFMDIMDLTSVHLVGNSMGGRIAMECAAMQPDRVKSLVLSAPAGIGSDTLFNFRLASIPVLGEILTKPSLFGLGMIWKLAFYNKRFVTPDMLVEKVALAQLPNAQTVFLKTLRSFVSFSGFLEAPRLAFLQRVASIKCPSLVIWGQQDQFLPVTHMQVLKPLLANAQYELIDHCGHVPMTEITDRFNQLTTNFLYQQTA
jgi:pimeloyl-ACP methyl ester carboxylesterase